MRGQFHRDESNRSLPAVSSLLTIAVAFWKGSLQGVRVKQRKNRRLQVVGTASRRAIGGGSPADGAGKPFNIAGDLLNVVARRDYRALIGIVIAGAMIYYLARCRKADSSSVR